MSPHSNPQLEHEMGLAHKGLFHGPYHTPKMNKTCIVMQTPVTIPITGASGRDSWGGLIPNIKQRMNWPGPRTWDEKTSHKMSGCGIGAERWEENASKRGRSVTLCMHSAQLGSGSSSRRAQAINVCCGDVACADESGKRGPPSKRGHREGLSLVWSVRAHRPARRAYRCRQLYY